MQKNFFLPGGVVQEALSGGGGDKGKEGAGCKNIFFVRRGGGAGGIIRGWR